MMNYLEKKKKAMLNAIQVQPSGYDVTLRTYDSGGNKVDVTINGVTTTYTMDEVRANPVDCGCVLLTYKALGANFYNIITKGTTTYNGVEYTKGKNITSIEYTTYNTYTYSGIDEPTPPKTTEWYMMGSTSIIIFTETSYVIYGALPNAWTQFGCIEFRYGSGATTIKAIKDLIYNGVTYQTGSQVLRIGYPSAVNAIFEEVE